MLFNIYSLRLSLALQLGLILVVCLVRVRKGYEHFGLPKYFWVAEHKWEEKEPPTNKEMMALLEKTETPRFFRAGRNFDYSNTGYFVLAALVEKISGLSYSEFVKKNIF